MKKVILYINQFFGGLGGEEQADFAPVIKEGPIGPGTAINALLRDAEITHTIICGDNYMNTNHDAAVAEILKLLEGIEFDMLLAGPAFQSGRYGMSCGEMCKIASERYHVPAITCMHEESPGVDAYRFHPDIYIMCGHKSAVKMRNDVKSMAALANKILAGETVLWAEAEGYFGHGIRKETFVEQKAADRVVDMLLAKLSDQPFRTEYPIEVHNTVKPAEAVKDIRKAKIAFVTTGGLVPMNNPDRLPSGTASVWYRYPIDQLDSLNSGEFYSIHGGFDNTNVNNDPEVLLPVAAAKEALREGKFAELEPYFYTTTGNLTALKEAERMGQEIGKQLIDDHVDAVILVST